MTIMHLTLAELANAHDDSWFWKDDLITFHPAGWDKAETTNEDNDHPIAECFAETMQDECSDD